MAILALFMMMGLLGGLLTAGDDGASGEGTDGSDRIEGTGGDDTINGLHGSDLIMSRAGADVISGGDGADWIFAGAGADVILGDAGNDVIVPGAGADTVDAGNGNDFVESADLFDQDVLNASLSSAKSFGDIRFEYDLSQKPDIGDQIALGDGNDTVVAGPGDTISSGTGQDRIEVGDWVSGGAPVEITDYDDSEDIITFAYEAGTPAPSFVMTKDPETGSAIISVADEPAIIIHGAADTFDPARIALKTYPGLHG